MDHGFRVLLLSGAWLFYAGGRVLCFIAQRLATGEASLAAECESRRSTAAFVRGASAAELRAGEAKRIADLIRARDCDRRVDIKFLPHGTIKRWHVPPDRGHN